MGTMLSIPRVYYGHHAGIPQDVLYRSYLRVYPGCAIPLIPRVYMPVMLSLGVYMPVMLSLGVYPALVPRCVPGSHTPVCTRLCVPRCIPGCMSLGVYPACFPLRCVPGMFPSQVCTRLLSLRMSHNEA